MSYGDLLILFDNIYGYSMQEEIKENICRKISLYYKYNAINYNEIKDVFDSFIYFNNCGVIDKISDSLFLFLKKILDSNNFVKNINYLSYMKYLLIPYSSLNPDNEKKLVNFLGEFDYLFSNILSKCNNYFDVELLRGINEEIFNLAKIRSNCEKEFINNNRLNKGIEESIINDVTLNHLTSIFYFNMDCYDNDYSLLEDAYKNILENSKYLLQYVKDNNLYNDILSFGFVTNKNIEKEYIFCKEILDKMYEDRKKKYKKV